jgi:hypothetical protein
MATSLVKPVGNRLQRNCVNGQLQQNREHQSKIQDFSSLISELAGSYSITFDNLLKMTKTLNRLTIDKHDPRQQFWKQIARSIQATLVREAERLQLADEALGILRQWVSIYVQTKPELAPENTSQSESRSSKFGELMIASFIAKARTFQMEPPFPMTDEDREILGLKLSNEGVRKKTLTASELTRPEEPARLARPSNESPSHCGGMIPDVLKFARIVQGLLTQLQALSFQIDRLTCNGRTKNCHERNFALRLLRIRSTFEGKRIKTLNKATQGILECRRVHQQLLTHPDLRPNVRPKEEDPRAAAIYSRLCREMMERAAALRESQC